MFKLMGKKIIAILRKLFLLNWPYEDSVMCCRYELSRSVSCSSQGTESDAIYLGDNVPVTLSEPVSSTMKGSYLGMSCPGV